MSAENAQDGIYARIAELAVGADAEALNTLADAYQKVTFGAQGGQTDTRTDYNYAAKIENFNSLQGQRQPAGFTLGSNGSS